MIRPVILLKNFINLNGAPVNAETAYPSQKLPSASLLLLRKSPSRLLLSVFLLYNLLGLAVLVVAGRYPTSLYVRNALFSKVVDDTEITDEAALNREIARSFRRDPPRFDPRSLFTTSELQRLDRYVDASRHARCRVASDHPLTRLTPADCLARRLAEDVSPYQQGGKCGLDGSLRARIGQVHHGVGCCSDYNEAFLMRAQAVGLQAREVHNMGHTMAEYFDPAEKRWKWIDTSKRVQIANWDGRLVSAYQRRVRLPWTSLRFVDLPPMTTKKDVEPASGFVGYLATSNSILFWTRGVNFQQQEALEAPLRRLGLPREFVQMLSLSLGVRPGWLVLAPPEAAFRFRLSAFLLWSSLLIFVRVDAGLLAGALGWRLSRERPFR